MQRDNAAHAAPDAPANDSRDSPLNRLLRKPASEAAKPASAPAAPVASAPQGMPPSAPQPTAPKPAAAPLSPAEMIVNKLRSKQAPTPLPRPESPRAQAVVPEVTLGEPVDVEFTPVETPAEKPQQAAPAEPAPAPAPVAAPMSAAAKPLDRFLPAAPASPPQSQPAAPPRAPTPASEATSYAPVVKPLETQAPAANAPLTPRPTAPQQPIERPAPAQEIARETPAEQPRAAEPSALQAAATPAASNPAPQAAAAPIASTSAPQVPAPQPTAPQAAPQAAMPEAPLATARTPDPAPQSPVQKLRAAAAPAPAQGTALQIPSGIVPRQQENAVEKSVGKLLRLPKRTRDEREFLPAALEIVDTPPSPVGRAIGLTIILVAIIAIVWSIVGKVDIVATASGRIVPAGKTKVVQPADTGIVTAIHVSDGDQVKAGDVLIELNSNQVSADRDRFMRDLLQANLNLARLRGLAATLPGTPGEGKKPNLVDPPKDAKPEDLALTQAAMRAQAANENAKLADLDQQIEAKRAEAAEAAANATKLQASLPMLADQEQLLRTMRDQKIGSKLDWYQINQQLIEQKHEIGVLAHRREAAEAAQRALREQRAAEATQYQMAILSELDKVRAQASELNAELAKSQQRVSQNVLLAPIAGTVQQLAIHTIGGVVTPAESLLAIVPHDDSLVVEAAVQNRDVGFISEGQTVRVKVEAFNFTLYGLIEGKVLSVTRDAVQPSNENKGKSNNQNEGDPAAADGQSGPVYMA
ncbi:MAG TPA: HlyD family type I secretion periplasmic adaptor subunit, partial [Dongiaceae bacterium]|nr:HlyD family type I secretion periplasmic adaptor subunit [Dongiaceae bacterium]